MGLPFIPPARLSADAAGFTVDNSGVKDAGYLTISVGTTGNRQEGTFRTCVKRTKLGTNQYIFWARESATDYFSVYFNSSDELRILINIGGASVSWISSAKFRDVTAHLDVCVGWDTVAQTLVAEVNGETVTWASSATLPTSGNTAAFYNAATHWLYDENSHAAPAYGYFSETVLVDGTMLSASNFGETDTNTGNWIQKAPDVSAYGTNGTYIPDPSTGLDAGTEGNDWTVTTITQSTDTPTNNHGVLNAVTPASVTGTIALSNGNKTIDTTGTTWKGAPLTFKIPDSGKFYIEGFPDATTTNTTTFALQVWDGEVLLTTSAYDGAGHWGFSFHANRNLNLNGTRTSSGSTITSTNRVQLAIDVDNDKLFCGLDDSYYDTVSTTLGDPAAGTNPTASGIGLAGKYITISQYGVMGGTIVVEEADWTHTAPTGFSALTTDNLPAMTATGTDQDIGEHLHTELVNHDGSSTAFTLPWPAEGTGAYHTLFEIKNRDNTEKWYIVDTLRGVTKILSYDDGAAVEGTDANVVSVSGSTVTLGSTLLVDNYDVTCHRAGLIGSETSGTTNHSKAYEYSVNTITGFQITTYTGSGTADHQIPHGHGKAPGFHYSRRRSVAGGWMTYHVSMGATKYAYLDDSVAFATATGPWNDTEPTSSNIILGVGSAANQSGTTIVNYSWSATPYCYIDSFEANGAADGPCATGNISVVNDLSKAADTAVTDWVSMNETRSPYNPRDLALKLNSTAGETVGHAAMDFNGSNVKYRQTGQSNTANTTVFRQLGQPTGASGSAEAPGQ